MQLFSAEATMLLKNVYHFFAAKNMKTLASKVAHNWTQIVFFSIADQPEIRPNLILCFIKMAPYGISI